MICPYSFDEPVGSGIPALLDGRYWCMGHIALGMSARRRRCPEDCPVDMGEWGAWRAVVGHLTHPYPGWFGYLYVPDRDGLGSWFKPWPDTPGGRALATAIGWSL